MKDYLVKMIWYSEVIVKANNKIDAEEKGKFSEFSNPHLDNVEVELLESELNLNQCRMCKKIEKHKDGLSYVDYRGLDNDIWCNDCIKKYERSWGK